jgi:L-ascorbate metabolism protein UlaG (beta-lactamase superfamily)
MSIKITSHGHSTISVNIDGIKLVVDPFFAENNPVAVKAVPDVLAEYILQTHGHYDHIQDTVELAKSTGAQVIANAEIINWINAQGYNNTHVLRICGSALMLKIQRRFSGLYKILERPWSI